MACITKWPKRTDVLELYDENGSSFFYCDRLGFQEISFIPPEQSQVMQL